MFYKRKFMIPSRQLVDHHMATNWSLIVWPEETAYVGPCNPPDLEMFRAYFPEFADIPDARIELMITEAACGIDGTWSQNCSGNDCTYAIMYLAAHLLTLAMFSAAALPRGGGMGVLPGGEITAVGFETMRVTYSASKMQIDKGSAGGSVYSYDSTPYGQRYLDLLKVNHPAIAIV